MFACTAYGAAAGAASIAGIITGIIAYVATRKPQQIPVAEVIDRIIQGVQLQQINGAFATMHRADVIGSFVLANAQSWVIHNYDTVKSVVANIDGVTVTSAAPPLSKSVHVRIYGVQYTILVFKRGSAPRPHDGASLYDGASLCPEAQRELRDQCDGISKRQSHNSASLDDNVRINLIVLFAHNDDMMHTPRAVVQQEAATLNKRIDALEASFRAVFSGPVYHSIDTLGADTQVSMIHETTISKTLPSPLPLVPLASWRSARTKRLPDPVLPVRLMEGAMNVLLREQGAVALASTHESMRHLAAHFTSSAAAARTEAVPAVVSEHVTVSKMVILRGMIADAGEGRDDDDDDDDLRVDLSKLELVYLNVDGEVGPHAAFLREKRLRMVLRSCAEAAMPNDMRPEIKSFCGNDKEKLLVLHTILQAPPLLELFERCVHDATRSRLGNKTFSEVLTSGLDESKGFPTMISTALSYIRLRGLTTKQMLGISEMIVRFVCKHAIVESGVLSVRGMVGPWKKHRVARRSIELLVRASGMPVNAARSVVLQYDDIAHAECAINDFIYMSGSSMLASMNEMSTVRILDTPQNVKNSTKENITLFGAPTFLYYHDAAEKRIGSAIRTRDANATPPLPRQGSQSGLRRSAKRQWDEMETETRSAGAATAPPTATHSKRARKASLGLHK